MSLADYRTEADTAAAIPRQPPNVYTMMLAISLVAILIGCLFLYLEMSSYQLSVRVPQELKVPPAQIVPEEEETPPAAAAPEQPTTWNWPRALRQISAHERSLLSRLELS